LGQGLTTASMTFSPFDRRSQNGAGGVTGRAAGPDQALDATFPRPYISTHGREQNRFCVRTLPAIMLNDVYNSRILELAGSIPRIGRMTDPHASATAHSKLCGSTVTVDLKMDGDVVTDFAHVVKACALGQAS